MRLTRLHVILIFIIVLVAAMYFVQNISRKKVNKLSEPEKTAQPQPAAPEIDEESIASKTIAIAGEYWKIAKKDGRDLTKGQMTLRQAKENFTAGVFDRSIDLAKQSIQEFKTAEKRIVTKHVEYKVKYKDNLWNIAKIGKHYGRGAMWVKIWRANEKKIPDFDIIHSGQILIIPK